MNRDRPRNGWNGRPKAPRSGWGRTTSGRVPQRPPQSYPAAGADYSADPTAVLAAEPRRPAGPPPGWRPPPGPPPGYRPPPRPGPPPRPRRPGGGLRLVKTVAVLLVLALVGFGVYVDTQLTRISALKSSTATSEGTNWLIVGSDSRADLTTREEKELHTGHAAGQRTDTIMLLHSGSSGSVLVSLPRDSLVSIPGHGKNKLNAAYSFGGPTLLVRTVEQATGLAVDHYAEIGFAGFVQVVDAVGGVDMCIDQAIRDPLAGIRLKAGCQELDGETALGYVRTRATPRADLDRIEHQREFLSALMTRMTSPATLLNPFRWVALTQALPGALTVDAGDHVWTLARLAWAMKSLSGGDGIRTTVPIAGLDSLNGSSVVRWDNARARALFNALAKDDAVPKSALG